MSTLDLDRRLADIAARPRTRRGVLAGAGGRWRSPPRSAACRSTSPTGRPQAHGADPFTPRRRLRRSRAGRGRAVDAARARAAAGRRRACRRGRSRCAGSSRRTPACAASSTAARATALAGVRPLGPRRGRRPRPRPRVLLPLHHRRGGQPRSAARAPRPAPAPRRRARVRVRRPARSGRRASIPPTARSPARTSTSSSTSATTSTSTGSPTAGGRATRSCRAEFAAETETLEQYRLRHALYKTDPDLQAAHAAHPFVVTWDDHEVVNDYSGARDRRLAASPARERLPRLLRAPAAAQRLDPARPGHADLPPAHAGATSPSSACSTRASTAPTSRAATARPRAAPPRSTRATTLTGAGAGALAAARARPLATRAGTSSPSRC